MSPPLTEVQLKHMVDRFLSWKLPANFNPDGGISFDRIGNPGTSHRYVRQPSGTNLLDAAQAEALVRHLVDGLASGEVKDMLTMTGCRDAADLQDMANVGNSLLNAIAACDYEGSPLKGWSPAEDPAEVVTDLVNMLDAAKGRGEQAAALIDLARKEPDASTREAVLLAAKDFALNDKEALAEGRAWAPAE